MFASFPRLLRPQRGTRAAVKSTGSEVPAGWQLPARWQLSIVTPVFDFATDM
jgi:hypothetical protein